VIFTELWEWLQGHPASQYIGFTWWFPFLESIHVIAITLVVGSILVVDLRLLGISGLQYSASRVTRELLPWTWGAFFVATLTGFGMFVTRATAYVENPAFQIKFLLLVVACLNMAIFHFRAFRAVHHWDADLMPPPAARAAGAASLVLWIGIILAGRWTGHII
jgi:hypothetical protein